MINNSFDRRLFIREIESIERIKLFSAQEKYYRQIAKNILSKFEGFEKVEEEKSGNKGVPFDFIALYGNELKLVELKGSQKYFNNPDKTQIARLYKILNDFKYDNFTIKAYLLQINLKKLSYHFNNIDLTKQIDPILGEKTSTDIILKNLYIYINTKTTMK